MNIGRSGDDRPRPTPAVMQWRLSGSLNALLACGIARRIDDCTIELVLSEQEARDGGMVTVAMNVPVQQEDGVVNELFSAWLAIPPEVADGTQLEPSTLLPGMSPIYFRVRCGR